MTPRALIDLGPCDPLSRLQELVGDTTLTSDSEAKKIQLRVEKCLNSKMNFQLREGDMVLCRFDRLPEPRMSSGGMGRGHSEVVGIFLPLTYGKNTALGIHHGAVDVQKYQF